MKVYDISVPLRADMPTYSGEPGLRLQFAKQLSKGDSANVSVLSLGSHTGTHVDAPSHFLDGAPGVDSLPPEALVGAAGGGGGAAVGRGAGGRAPHQRARPGRAAPPPRRGGGCPAGPGRPL